MRTFPQFKVGNIVRVRKEVVAEWELLDHSAVAAGCKSHLQPSYTVLEIRLAPELSHMYQETCERSHCRHDACHDQLLTLDTASYGNEEMLTVASGWWFEVTSEAPKLPN